jgi:hypothetical protein
MKKCTLCKQSFEATLEFFGSFKQGKNGLHPRCRSCEKKRKQEWSNKNKKRLKANNKKYYQENKEYIKQKTTTYYKENREEVLEKQKLYASKNKDKIKEYKKQWSASTRQDRIERYHSDANYRLKINCRNRIAHAMRNNGVKSASTMELVGCSIDELKQHLESKFTDGMNWDNYGEWHVDHIKPCASFDLSDPDQQRQCFHYTNLQPLWEKDNLKKGSSL